MELYKHKFITPVRATDFKIKDYISYEHFQDCCEEVYIDFEHLDTFRWEIDKMETIVGISINSVEWEWIVIFLYSVMDEKYESCDKRFWIFLACRNSQNGYYSDDLTLIIKHNDTTVKIDLQEKKAVNNIIS